jgi:hypothetical protein
MKKRSLLFAFIGVFVYFGLTAYHAGPASMGYDRTGASGGNTACGSVAAGCHASSTAGVSVSLSVDSGTSTLFTVTHYKSYQPYKVIVSSSNSKSYTHHGLQLAVVTSNGYQAGVWNSFLASQPYSDISAGSCAPNYDIIEHNQTLSNPSGISADTFNWVAPNVDSGAVTFYVTYNAVNNNTLADTNDVGNHNSVTLQADLTSVSNFIRNTAVKAYPNPFGNQFRLQLNNADAGTYTLRAFDMSGRLVMNQSLNIFSGNSDNLINTANWINGFYSLQILNQNGEQKVITVVKQ